MGGVEQPSVFAAADDPDAEEDGEDEDHRQVHGFAQRDDLIEFAGAFAQQIGVAILLFDIENVKEAAEKNQHGVDDKQGDGSIFQAAVMAERSVGAVDALSSLGRLARIGDRGRVGVALHAFGESFTPRVFCRGRRLRGLRERRPRCWFLRR